MKYSNGFDMDLVLPALQQRLGWDQPTYSGAPVLDTDNTTSASGRLFGEDFHALCTIQNIKANQEDPAIDDTKFNAYLAKRQNGMILRALNQTFRKKELIEQHLMYTRFGFSDVVLPNQGNMAGWCIEIADDQAISTQITFATLYFDADATFNLYLFQDGVRGALKTIPVTSQAFKLTTVAFELTNQLVLPFKTGTRFYLLYDQDELQTAGVRAIREQPESIASPKCFEGYSIQMPKTTDGSVFNVNQRQYPALPMGINLEVVSFKDHTQRIIRQANLFDEVQGLQMAAFAMELVNNGNRTNATARINEQQSQQQFMELNQAFATKEVPVTPGLKSRIMAEFKRLRETFYPAECAVSVSMISEGNGLDSYEQNWMKQNVRVANNPGLYVSSN